MARAVQLQQWHKTPIFKGSFFSVNLPKLTKRCWSHWSSPWGRDNDLKNLTEYLHTERERPLRLNENALFELLKKRKQRSDTEILALLHCRMSLYLFLDDRFVVNVKWNDAAGRHGSHHLTLLKNHTSWPIKLSSINMNINGAMSMEM